MVLEVSLLSEISTLTLSVCTAFTIVYRTNSKMVHALKLSYPKHSLQSSPWDFTHVLTGCVSPYGWRSTIEQEIASLSEKRHMSWMCVRPFVARQHSAGPVAIALIAGIVARLLRPTNHWREVPAHASWLSSPTFKDQAGYHSISRPAAHCSFKPIEASS